MNGQVALAAASVVMLTAALVGIVLVVSDRLPLRWHRRVAVGAFACFLLALAFRGLS